ncbi:MAG TPA: CaiB/BaiF CoA-transferase family protein [Micrococcaceae bacterium]|jgi:crotonobetainyl-CoA:carnitine CoA-transferase CaiB-like acyl-CoA transferase|nr:CaiB/BaiF CoA-transferase family protein [Micrococcaceae bacterium]
MTASATPTAGEPQGALQDLLVLDLTRILSGPFATMTLADLGADVIKIEQPGTGDDTSGYGQTGPEATRAGYDAIAQARSGIMSVTGEAGGPPVRVGVSSADLAAGMWATIGILAALHEKQRTGLGQWVDISLLDGSVAWLTYVASGYFTSGKTPRRYGSAHPTIAPYQAFASSDGHVMVAVGNVDQAVQDPQIIARGMVLEMQHPTAGKVNTVGCPIRLTRTPASVRMPPPLLGQQTDEILSGLGYDGSDIAALHARGAVE